MSITRRRFLGFAAGAAGGAALGGRAGRGLSALFASAESPIRPLRGPEQAILSVCDLCTGGCGIRIRRVGDRVVKVEGNPLHPVSGGRVCLKGQAAVQSLYHPDRATGPLRRVGPRGSLASFERVSWDHALGEIAGRLRAIRETRPESLVLLRRRGVGIAPRLARRFLETFGSPNDVVLDRGDEAAALALLVSQGVRVAPAFDVQSSDYVLSLGSSLLEAWGSPVHMSRAYGAFRQGRAGRRGKLVQVEPRLSITGCSADEWVAVRPGTEGVFALGVAGAIVAEGLYAKEFVADRTQGFEDAHDTQGRLRPGLRGVLARQYPLERVALETGVSSHAILRIAREFAAARTSLAVGPRRGPLLPGLLFDHLAAGVLNALAGNVDSPGGVLVPEEPPLAAWPATAAGATRRPRLDGAGGVNSPLLGSDAERLAEAILAGEPYRAEAVLILGADPAFTSSAPDRFIAAIERVPLTVSFATLPDDSALLADWILPEAHFLERWDLHTNPPGVPYPVVSLAQPGLARPLHDVRPAAEVFLDLARRISPDLAAALPWSDLPALLRAEMDGLFAARRGAVMGTPFDEAWVRMMEGAGWWAPGYRSADELWERARESGGWWDPFYDHGDWKRVLRTGSGRYELRPELLERPGAQAGDAAPHTGKGPEAGWLALLLFEPLPVAGGTGAELPFLEGLLDPGHEERWETWVEIHPETAAPRSVKDGEWVRVESPQGSLVARARVTSRVVAGAVAMPVGLGKRGGGRWASGAGANPLRLVRPARDPLCALPDLGATSVRLSRAAAPGRD